MRGRVHPEPFALTCPSPAERPLDLGPGLEVGAAGTGPLVAALNRVQVCLEGPVGAVSPPSPERVRLQRVFSDLADGIHTHLLKEDVMFFPALRHLAAGCAAQVPLGLHLQGPVDLLRGEHAALLGALEAFLARLGGVTSLSRAESGELRAHVAALGRALRDHVQLQEEVLFPRVLAGAASAP